jgi:hypothetical protein
MRTETTHKTGPRGQEIVVSPHRGAPVDTPTSWWVGRPREEFERAARAERERIRRSRFHRLFIVADDAR